ncbi:citrate transporter [Thermosipho melanesiensis]|uniref:Citrate transporter n=2 Tax=Thermosipho melanesiensis TaxID=46541 RepID=A6LNB9_THEM4|nr:SLC13 family permease [Thermosipho melanesiensis]ABR31420.1 Citrate transporter [Thermosipho melanesiensis BI429]APT74479.1 citrate transporter [Thermosipho melanesiensis]OOC36439.1 citrate transporter [Thermosipho melanesiensis]OOC37257.1 citrate transporter [Thermosipho melanesiensis]OOC38009.1 citrate transporter [Thermosipho melanesiensis]
MSVDAIIALIVFVIVYYLIISEKIHRSIAVVLGAFVLTFFGVFEDPDYLFKNYVDFDTIFLLIGMMLLVSAIKSVGFFEYVAFKIINFSKNSILKIFILINFFVALFSAFVDNVTTIMIFIPITLAIADAANIDPTFFVLSEVFSSNIGGTTTLIGDPPNILIGNAARLTFNDFIFNTGIPSIITLMVILVFFILKYRDFLKAEIKFEFSELEFSKSNLIKSFVLLTVVILLFVFQEKLKIHSSVIAFGMGFVSILVIDPKNLEKHFTEIEWSTIFFFIGLFIITGALEDTGILRQIALVLSENFGDTPSIFGIGLIVTSFFISGFFDNIPFTATMIPVIKMLPTINASFSNLMPFWWALSLGVCYGGNFTPIGASANIVAITMLIKYSKRSVSFKEFLKFSLVPSIISLIISILYVEIRYF